MERFMSITNFSYNRLASVLIHAATCCVIQLSSMSAFAMDRIVNEEYGFSVLPPDDLQPCEGHSWTHIHGIGVRLDGTSCESGPSDKLTPAFSIWADYNILF